MKRKFMLAMALLLCAALAVGCADGNMMEDGGVALPTEGGTQVINPVASVENTEAFSALGVMIDAPQNAKEVAYSTIAGEIAQVEFTLDGHVYTYRAAKGGEDISGVFSTFAEEVLTVNWEFEAEDVSADIRTASEGGRLATWQEAGASYSLWTADSVSDDAISSLVLKLVVMQGLADQEQEPAPFEPIDFREAGSCEADLDGDGALETVTLTTTMDEYEWAHVSLTVTTADGTVYELSVGEETWLMEIQWLTALQVVDIDPDDKLLEIVVSGDVCSNDYITLVCRFNGAELQLSSYEEPRYGGNCSGLRGQFESVQGDGTVIVCDNIDVLGTWGGMRRYMLADDGTFVFVPVPGELWQRTFDNLNDWETEYDPALETKAELPVTLDGSGETTLPAGTKLMITGSDETSIARFVLQDGRTGSIAFTRNADEWFARINGVEEEAYFVMLPYAG